MKVYPRQFPLKINSKWYDGSRKWNENFQFEYSSDIRHLLHSWIFTIFLYYSYFLCRQFVMLLQLRVQIKAESERNTWSMNGSCVKMNDSLVMKSELFLCLRNRFGERSNTSEIYVWNKSRKKCRLVSFENDRRNMNRTWKICHSISKSVFCCCVINAWWFAYFIFKHIFTRRISALIGK